MRFFIALIIGCLTGCILFGQTPQKLRRADSFWGLHFDRHSVLTDSLLGKTLTEAMIDSILKKARPDFIQVDCKGHPGVSSYPTQVGQQATSYAKDPLALIRKVTNAHGVALYVHYSGLQDQHYVAQRPEEARFTPEGKSDGMNTSLWGPYVDKLLIPQMKELIDNYDIDGVWIDGECWAVQPDYQPAALKEFTEKTGITDIPRSVDAPHYKTFLEFNRQKFIGYLDHYTRVLHAYNPEFQICSNWAFSSLMPEPVTVGVDFLSGDFGPANALTTAAWQSRCLSGQRKPWDLMAWSFTVDWSGKNLPSNPKTALQLCQEGAEVLAMGGGFQVYFRQNADLSMQPASSDIMKDIADFVLPRREFCHKAVPVPQVALLYSTAGWKNNVNIAYLNIGVSGILGTLSALLDGQHAVEILMTHQLEQRLDQYPVVVIPEWEYIEPALVARLKSYVNNGGNILVIGAKATRIFNHLPDVNENNDIALSRLYLGFDKQMVQVNCNYRSIQEAGNLQKLGGMFSATDFRFPAGVAATISEVGRGKIAAVYADLGNSYLLSTSPVIRDFLSHVLDTLFTSPLLKIEGSKRVHVVPTRKNGKLLVNLINTSGDHSNPNYLGFDEIPSLRNLKVTVKLPQKPDAVVLQPEGTKVKFKYADGKAVFVVPELEIHTVVEFR